MHPGRECDTLKFQVWRATSGSTDDYKLIGENTLDPALCLDSLVNSMHIEPYKIKKCTIMF